MGLIQALTAPFAGIVDDTKNIYSTYRPIQTEAEGAKNLIFGIFTLALSANISVFKHRSPNPRGAEAMAIIFCGIGTSQVLMGLTRLIIPIVAGVALGCFYNLSSSQDPKAI